MITRLGLVAIDGGTWSGVMRLFGEVRSDADLDFPLLGVAAVGTVMLPGAQPRQDDAAGLDPDHSHFLLVPGDEWGAEAGWIARVATVLAGDTPSATVLINGGEIAIDVERAWQLADRCLPSRGRVGPPTIWPLGVTRPMSALWRWPSSIWSRPFLPRIPTAWPTRSRPPSPRRPRKVQARRTPAANTGSPIRPSALT